MMWPASSPNSGPPRSWRYPALSSARFSAFRTFTSSNGGSARFISMYRTASEGSEWIWSSRLGSLAYRAIWVGGGTPSMTMSISAASTLFARSASSPPICTSMRSTNPSRRSSLSGSYEGFRTRTIERPMSYPEAGSWSSGGSEKSSWSVPSNMYGPVGIRKRP